MLGLFLVGLSKLGLEKDLVYVLMWEHTPFFSLVFLRDPHGIATKKDKLVSLLMIILAVFSDVIAIYSDAYSLLT